MYVMYMGTHKYAFSQMRAWLFTVYSPNQSLGQTWGSLGQLAHVPQRVNSQSVCSGILHPWCRDQCVFFADLLFFGETLNTRVVLFCPDPCVRLKVQQKGAACADRWPLHSCEFDDCDATVTCRSNRWPLIFVEAKMFHILITRFEGRWYGGGLCYSWTIRRLIRDHCWQGASVNHVTQKSHVLPRPPPHDENIFFPKAVSKFDFWQIRANDTKLSDVEQTTIPGACLPTHTRRNGWQKKVQSKRTRQSFWGTMVGLVRRTSLLLVCKTTKLQTIEESWVLVSDYR